MITLVRFVLAVSMVILILSGIGKAQVTEAWSPRYNGPGSGTDEAKAIAVDLAGNTYVTGSSMSGGGGTEDYATIKYNTAGVEEWVRRYNGTGSSIDIAYAIAVDTAGYVYVTGGSGGIFTYYDYVTIKYTPSGDTVWTRRYNGPRGGKDIAYSLAIDDSGNVYVTGESEGLTGTHGIFEDYATIKYDSTGLLKWTSRYNGPAGDYDRANAIGVDGFGNVYVTGISDGGSSGSGMPHFDYATIKYDSAGSFKWAMRYNGPANGDDEAKDLKVTSSGNVFVTGYSLVAAGDEDYTTIKYNTLGVLRWASTYNGPASNIDEANALALDDSGNVYVAGKSYGGSGSLNDFATVKYDSLGDSLWVQRYDGPDIDQDGATAIALDRSSNVFVTGYSSGGLTGSDYATIKYNPSGLMEWVIRYANGDAAGSADSPNAIAIDTASNVYVTGMSALDYATVKYTQTTTGVDPNPQEVPNTFALLQNYPNPFNPSTQIEFQVSTIVFVTLKVYNVLGEEIAVLVNEAKAPGAYSVSWDAGNCSSGVYFYRLQAGQFIDMKKLVLLR